MITFPNAKINLGLHVLEKRNDGFHNIESCFYPIPICDILEVIPAHEFSFSVSGLKIPDDSNGNLVLKAYELLSKHRSLPSLAIHLHKVIPMGAGLGGGSSDATNALKMFDELFNLQLTQVQLNALASELGSDCTFFLKNMPAIATGKGATLEPIELMLEGYRIELRFTDVHISTKNAYSMIKPRKRNRSIREIISLPISEWQGQLINDFEEPIMHKHPEIQDMKNKLLNEGAIYASLTGTGSTVFGLFKETKLAQ